jgi:O-acetyl-ADP-ribose deacetylase (regulator of RNase III)
MTETNIFYETGDIQFSTCQTIVVPVNCEGTMDEGIASIFRRRYPYMLYARHEHCLTGESPE